ncbi:MAG: glycosyltransferase 87 family protein [Acidimicrobiales bacterium]
MVGEAAARDEPGQAAPRRPAAAAAWLVLALVAVRVVAVVVLATTHQESPDAWFGQDVVRYQEIVTATGTPYRDVAVEYPPLTYVLLRAVSGSTVAASIVGVALSQLACDLGAAAALGWAWGRRTAVAYLLLGLPLVLNPFIYLRIDLLAVLLAALGIASVRRGRDGAGGVALAAGVLAKLWPVVVAPVLLVERRRRGLLAGGVALAAGVAAWGWVGATTGIAGVVSFRGATGWQIESLVGSVLHVVDPAAVREESGAFRTGTVPDGLRGGLTLLGLVVAGVAWWLAARRRRADGAATAATEVLVYGHAPLAAVLALLVFATIVSPQYVVWLLPFAAVATVGGDRLVGGATLAVVVVTSLTFAALKPEVDGEAWALALLLVRNAGLVALLGITLAALGGWRGAPATARSPRPAGRPA